MTGIRDADGSHLSEQELAGLNKRDERRNPYEWRGDKLVHTGDKVVVAVFSDFPSLVRMRELREQQEKRLYGIPTRKDRERRKPGPVLLG